MADGRYDWLAYVSDTLTLVVENLMAYLDTAAIYALHSAGVPLFLGRRFVYDGTVLAPPGLVFNSGAAGTCSLIDIPQYPCPGGWAFPTLHHW